VQVAFPFVLFGRLKYVFVTILLGMQGPGVVPFWCEMPGLG
jgi:hypothetical protein